MKYYNHIEHTAMLQCCSDNDLKFINRLQKFKKCNKTGIFPPLVTLCEAEKNSSIKSDSGLWSTKPK